MADLNIGIVGTKFMGKAHSNAYISAPKFFDLPAHPVMKAACGRNEEETKKFANIFGWETYETSWEKLIQRDDIDIVDISTPNNLHHEVAIAAAKAGKNILCEKPMARDLKEAKEMLDAVENANITHMMIFNYRFVPAIALAKRMIDEGKLGEIYHFNAVYYQDFLSDPDFPMMWRHDAKISGSGATGDLGAHVADLARYLVGEIGEVTGLMHTFTKERPQPDGKGKGKVTVDDTAYMLAHFKNGALGHFNVTRNATGKKNFMRLEVFGRKGGITFNLERLNELEYYNAGDEGDYQGFRTIYATEGSHPYMSAYYPPGHIIGWEHTFIHEVTELVKAVHSKKQAVPNFHDGYKNQQILEALANAHESRKWVEVDKV